jgi:hypothetical protein
MTVGTAYTIERTEVSIIDFNLIFPIPFFLVYFTVTGNNHSLQGPNACNGNVKLHVRGLFFFTSFGV